MAELREKIPGILDASPTYKEEQMTLEPPLDPLFRVGELSLGYDPEQDLLILIAREIPTGFQEGDEEEDEEKR